MATFDITKIKKEDLFDLITEYDNYVYNDGEPWDKDRQPVGIFEFHNNEYQELIKMTPKKVTVCLMDIIEKNTDLEPVNFDCGHVLGTTEGFFLTMPDGTEFAITIASKGDSL